jgi:RHS repeat-associated protein
MSGRHATTACCISKGTGWTERAYSYFPATSFFRMTQGTAAPHSGSFAYVMSNHPYGRLLSEPVLVRPDTEYDLYAWMRGEINPDDGEGLWLIGAYFYDSNGWYDGFATAALGGAGTLDGTWQQKGGKIRTSSEAATLRVYLYHYMNDGWVAFDDVSLGEVTRKYYYFGGQRVAMRRNGVLQYILGDHLGTTSLVLDDQGNRIAESRHLPYGEERWSWVDGGGDFPTEYRFTGQREDGYIKLTVMGARWYDSELGRWTSPDTIIPDSTNPQSFNRFSYVYNNPLRFVDPTGHCAQEDTWCWQSRWYRAHGYEWSEGEWVYAGNYVFADKLVLAETLADIATGHHQVSKFTSFSFVDGSLTYSLVQRGQDNDLSNSLSSIAFGLDTIDTAITGSFALAYTVAELASAAIGGPPGAIAALLAGDAGYKAVGIGLLFVDGGALGSIALADMFSGRSGIDFQAHQVWVGLDTIVSAATFGWSASFNVAPVCPGVYFSLAGDIAQMVYDFARAAGLPGYSLQVQW